MVVVPTGELFSQVAVDQPIDGELTYRVPKALRRAVLVGARVTVPLGRGKRTVAGTVLALTDEAPRLPEAAAPEGATGELFVALPESGGGVKAIAAVSEGVHPVPADLIELARWVSVYYCCPIGMVLATMVPAAVKKAVRLPVQMMVHRAGGSDGAARLEALSAKARKTWPRIAEALAAGPREERALLGSLEVTRAMLRKFVDAGLARIERVVEAPRHEWGVATPPEAPGPESRVAGPPPSPEPLVLTAEQHAALDDVLSLLDPPRFAVRVIHGVTGSGKTELYIRAIERVVAQGKRAIVLVPEIALTPQTVRRFTQRFPRVAVLHSGLRDAQRHQHWHAIVHGWAQVIVGARSAIFAPAANIGLIVVDEEHDGSYKQDNAPKYHGRDVAIRRAQMLNVPVLLGSATPALESWHNAHQNPHYKLLSLTQRPRGMAMPRVMVVDMREQTKERRGLHILSTHLEFQLKAALEKKQQAIMLLNRRGYAHYVMCPRCDWVLMCERCDSTMVVHRSRRMDDAEPGSAAAARDATRTAARPFAERYGQVQCHYCMTAMLLPRSCPVCQAKLTYLGQGTQRAEDEFHAKFATARVARMDSDTMHNAQAYQRTLEAFGRRDIDILLGTQMISKGLDFPNVALVGVLNSDLAMTMPDFRAAERTFQLICQVAGRSGRDTREGAPRGLVVVQTFQPYEPAIRHACNHDYLSFAAGEMEHRREFGFPPYGRLVRIVLSHRAFVKVREAAQSLAGLVGQIIAQQSMAVRVQGPQPPPMEKLADEYRSEIILQAATPGPLQRILAAARARGALVGPVAVSVDVDPVQMM